MAATHKMVNGVEVPLSPEEAAAIEAGWATNPPPTAQQALDQLRLQANAALDAQEDRFMLLIRSIVKLVADRDNQIANRFNALLTAIDNGSNLAAVKTAVATINDLPTFTLVQVRQAIKDQVTAGDADA